MEIILLSLAAFFSTLMGGLFTVKFRNKLHLIMSFTAGVLLGVVSFDILPEIFSQLKERDFNIMWPMIALVVGFLLFHTLEKIIVIHHAHESSYAEHKHPDVGILSAIALASHSFVDGMGIGLGFQVSPTVGLLVAIAVISHDFTDGMNTVTLMINNNNSVKKAKRFLFLVAITPIIGALSTLFFKIPPQFLILYLGVFAGFLLYIGASDILPEAHSKHSSLKMIGLTALGAFFIFLITNLLSGS